MIEAITGPLSVPVLTNGNIWFQDDGLRPLEETGCVAAMSTNEDLDDVVLFHGLPPALPVLDYPDFRPICRAPYAKVISTLRPSHGSHPSY